jgi:hypothetical protein
VQWGASRFASILGIPVLARKTARSSASMKRRAAAAVENAALAVRWPVGLVDS